MFIFRIINLNDVVEAEKLSERSDIFNGSGHVNVGFIRKKSINNQTPTGMNIWSYKKVQVVALRYTSIVYIVEFCTCSDALM